MRFTYLGEPGPHFHHNGIVTICSSLENQSLYYGFNICKIGENWIKGRARGKAQSKIYPLNLGFYQQDNLWFLKLDNVSLRVNTALLTLIILIHIQDRFKLDEPTKSRLSTFTLEYTEKLVDQGIDADTLSKIYQKIELLGDSHGTYNK